MSRNIAIALLVVASSSSAQDTTAQRLTPIVVSITREARRSTFDLASAVSRVSLQSRQGIRGGSLAELLLPVPGLTVSNRFNPTQDPRIAVRGFGARSAFGIRGIRILRDGIPLSLADGQASLDFVDLETIASTEVMRGAAGALYGNAAGGVLELRTEPLVGVSSRVASRVTYNEDASRAMMRGQIARATSGARATLTSNRSDGPRDYSRARSTTLSLDGEKRLGNRSRARASVIVFDSPLAQNPGAVTAAELRNVPYVADSQNIRRRASKTAQQQTAILQGDREWAGGTANVGVFGGIRHLDNPQSFAIIDLERRFTGLTASVQHRTMVGQHMLRLSAGSDIQWQHDDRKNYTNCASNAAPSCSGISFQGPETLNQVESIQATGAYLRAEVRRAFLAVTGALRFDRTDFAVRDRRARSRQQTDMSAVTPTIGVSVSPFAATTLYANFAGSFETPTATELANQPDGSTGINTELLPQKGWTREVGVKRRWGNTMYLEASGFAVRTNDELIPFEIPNSSGRRYFRNAGETSRRGAEVFGELSVRSLALTVALSSLKYEYTAFSVGGTSLRGKRVPGVAPRNAAATLTYRAARGFLTVESQLSARTPVDDANSMYAPSFTLWNVRVGGASATKWQLQPVIGVDNAFARIYAANVVTNAARGRFFEPGAGRRVFLALSAGARP